EFRHRSRRSHESVLECGSISRRSRPLHGRNRRFLSCLTRFFVPEGCYFLIARSLSLIDKMSNSATTAADSTIYHNLQRGSHTGPYRKCTVRKLHGAFWKAIRSEGSRDIGRTSYAHRTSEGGAHGFVHAE